MSTTADKIRIMQAYVDGKCIQINAAPNGMEPCWCDYRGPSWDWAVQDYRIKPEPRKPREVFLYVSSNDSMGLSFYDRDAKGIKFREVIEDESSHR